MEGITEMTSAPKKKAGRPYAAGRQAFLAAKDQLVAHLEAGGTLSGFYRDRGKKLVGNLSYSQLARYVQRYIKEQPTVPPAAKESGVTTDETRTSSQPAKPASTGPKAAPRQPGQPARFNRDDLDPEELI